ncbi:uncharacterized protein HMPREF1541_07883 [Cyphellophora europaea CBS 101466]|uniref:Zn(2)-C6 fungal-type domain-containing protein n=1 Tax=Cyphellophora europaea (strain CBS 101466) TaxID=1220924 RepID=W2RKB8_CYPE1|nr:uncharacterized protein HMPREF1541_07883 [Cyphellophora europaea CBS 101466]ETN36896.1 hypothetical protein HMPREF1541_07883 [Cyphellophora europaea CBS 101466]
MDRPQPLESQPPDPQRRESESLSALRSALQEAKNAHDIDIDSQPDDDASNEEGSPDKPARRPKRARACIACRNMKIRCLPVQGQEACLACSKVNRECVMPGPARKRQKTVHKVAELEKKINALTDALIAQQAANPTPPNDSPNTDRQETQSDVTRTNTTITSDPQRESERLSSYGKIPVENPNVNFEQGHLDWGCSKFEHPREKLEPYADIIERALLDMPTANKIFGHYVNNMLPHFPVLAFPGTITAQDVRTARPMLFLAILTVAAPAIKPELHGNLVVELTRQLSERVLFVGEKSLEVVQAILVYTNYYTRNKYAKDLTFNQLIHSAVVMCLDLGMGKRYKSLQRDRTEEAEVRRTWLSCYYFASNVSILLRHPSLVRWSPYLEDSIAYLGGPTASDADRWLCALVRTQQIAEEVSLVFNMDDQSSNVSFGDTSTQYHLKAFEKQLAAWHDSVPASINSNVVSHIAASINLYVHEIGLHLEHDSNMDDWAGGMKFVEGRPGSTAPLPSGNTVQPTTAKSHITITHIDALAQCLDSSHKMLDAWLALPLSTGRNLPNLGIVWNTYAIVALIKLHGVLSAPDSKFLEVFSPELRVDYYILAVIERLQELAADGRCPPAEAFVYVVRKLRSWFEHKRSGFPEQHSDADDGGDVSAGVKAGGDGGFVASHKRYADDVMRLAQERDILPQDLPRSGSLSQRPSPNLDPAGAPFDVGGSAAQASQPLVGTSSMPSSQMNPMGIGGNGGGGFPASQQVPGSGPFANNNSSNSQFATMSDLNVAYNAASYNINWDELNFSQQEMNLFDEYMGERGWMGYII